MPAFTFEKISPSTSRKPVDAKPSDVPESKPRGVIVQMIDRLAEARIQRRKGVIADNRPKRGP